MFELPIQLIVLLTLFVIAGTWTFTSTFSIKTWAKNLFALRGIIIILLESLLFFQSLDMITFPLPQTAFDRYFVILGLIINFFGAFLAIWAKFRMQNNWGVPAQHNINKQKYLVTNGPYAFSRNPIYVGLFCVVLGSELALRSLFLIVSIPMIIGIYKIILIEESLLEEHFGKNYLVYKEKVPRFLKLNGF